MKLRKTCRPWLRISTESACIFVNEQESGETTRRLLQSFSEVISEACNVTLADHVTDVYVDGAPEMTTQSQRFFPNANVFRCLEHVKRNIKKHITGGSGFIMKKDLELTAFIPNQYTFHVYMGSVAASPGTRREQTGRSQVHKGKCVGAGVRVQPLRPFIQKVSGHPSATRKLALDSDFSPKCTPGTLSPNSYNIGASFGFTFLVWEEW